MAIVSYTVIVVTRAKVRNACAHYNITYLSIHFIILKRDVMENAHKLENFQFKDPLAKEVCNRTTRFRILKKRKNHARGESHDEVSSEPSTTITLCESFENTEQLSYDQEAHLDEDIGQWSDVGAVSAETEQLSTEVSVLRHDIESEDITDYSERPEIDHDDAELAEVV